MPLRLYTLATCDTCRTAKQWLQAHAIEFEEIPIRERPPSPAELRQAAAARGGTRPLFNTSGREYRAQRLSERMPDLTSTEAITLLAGNGSLVKRPFAIGEGIALVGFDEAGWREAFGLR